MQKFRFNAYLSLATFLITALPHSTIANQRAKDRVLWDAWYTVTVNKVIHYEYYNEHVEMKGGKVYFQNHLWKNEEDYVNEEQLGAFAENDSDLTPLFYNFHSTYRTTETKIDGTVQTSPSGTRQLVVKVRKGNSDLPVVRRSIPSKTFFSVFFPVWLGLHMKQLKPDQITSFMTILEDRLEQDFSPVTGETRLEKPDAYAIQTKTNKVLVNFHDMRTYWWVNAAGVAMRIEMPEQKTHVERVTESIAQHFLDND